MCHPDRSLPKFTVLRRVDAYVDYTAEIEAADAQEAVLLARMSEDSYDWRDAGVVQFDARGFVTLDADGSEIDATRMGDF
jgi:hypothetical protein